MEATAKTAMPHRQINLKACDLTHVSLPKPKPKIKIDRKKNSNKTDQNHTNLTINQSKTPHRRSRKQNVYYCTYQFIKVKRKPFNESCTKYKLTNLPQSI